MRRRLWLGLLLPLVVLQAGRRVRAEEMPGPWADRSLEAWIEDLSADDADRREAATRALFLHAPDHSELAPHLLRRLGDGVPTVRLAALQTLLQLVDAPAIALEQAVRDADPRVAMLAVDAQLARGEGDPDVRVATLARLASAASRTPVRVRALERLEALGEAAAAAAPALVPSLDEADPYTRQELVRVLVAMGPGALPALLEGEATGQRLLVAEAIQSLHDGGEPSVWWRMRRMVRGETDSALAADALAKAPDACRPYLPELKDALRRGVPRDEAIRGAMARIVRHAEPKVDLAFWKKRLAAGALGVREEAAWALAPYADDLPGTWSALIQVLCHSQHLQSGAAEALVRIGLPIVPALHEAWLGARGAVPRLAGALVLAQIREGVVPLVEPLAEDLREPGGRAAWPRLVLLHIDPSRTHLHRMLGWSLRGTGKSGKQWFLTSLGRIRRPDDPLLGGLEGLIEDDEAPLDLRLEAVHALGRFAPSSGLAMWLLLDAGGRPEEEIAFVARQLLVQQDEAAWGALMTVAAREMAPPKALPRLTRAEVEKIEPRFVAREKRIRTNSIFEVSRQGDLSDDVVRAIAYCLDDRALSVRLAAAHSLSHRGHVVEERLLKLLSDDNLEIRGAAAQGLRLAGGSTEASLPYLLEAFRDIDPAVERAIQGSIAKRDVRFAHLIRRYREQGSDMAYELLSRIAKHGEDAWPILPLVPRWLEVEKPRHAAIHVLLGMGTRGRKALAIALASADPETTVAIARAYERRTALTEGEALWLRDRAVQFDRIDASWPCFRAIAKHGVWKKSSVATLVQKLEREPKRLEAGIAMLGRSGSEHAAPFLATLLDDETHRRAALHALAALGPKAGLALDALCTRIPVADRDELHEILAVLAAMGTAAAPATDDLLELLGGDERVDAGHVMRRLVRILPEETSVLYLQRELLDPDPNRRLTAAGVVGESAHRERLRQILGWLEADPDHRVRNAADLALWARRR